MVNQIKKVFSVNLHGIHMKIFRTGTKVSITPSKDPNVMLGIHSHFTYEVFFVTNGSLELITESDTMVFEKKVVIIPPWLKHFSMPSGEESFCLLFSFEKRKTENNGLLKKIEKKLNEGMCDFPLSEEVAFYIRKFSEKSDEHRGVSEQACNLLASLIFNEIISFLLENTAEIYLTNPATTHINEIEQYINSHLGHKITLEEISKNVNLSIRHINRIIKKEYGCTFTELVTEKRLAVAKMLLKNTDTKIHDIAEQIYPGSENSFYTLFKKKFGISPLKYRKNYLESKKY